MVHSHEVACKQLLHAVGLEMNSLGVECRKANRRSYRKGVEREEEVSLRFHRQSTDTWFVEGMAGLRQVLLGLHTKTIGKTNNGG